jgi:hypothetical protein
MLNDHLKDLMEGKLLMNFLKKTYISWIKFF